MQTTAALLVLALLATLASAQKNYQESCDQVTAQCNSALGLFCNPETSQCECVSGQVFDDKYNYVMEWDDTVNSCAAAKESICHGTAGAESPHPVKCRAGLNCEQSEEHRDSVGFCRSGASEVLGSGVMVAVAVLAMLKV